MEPLSNIRDINHFFSVITEMPISKNHLFIHPEVEGMHIGNHLVISGPGVDYTSGKVYVTSYTVELAEQHLIPIAYDEIYFELIMFDDCAHLYIKYNQIIGSRLMAIIDLATIPDWIRKHALMFTKQISSLRWSGTRSL
jgi:hypothetical protein